MRRRGEEKKRRREEEKKRRKKNRKKNRARGQRTRKGFHIERRETKNDKDERKKSALTLGS